MKPHWALTSWPGDGNSNAARHRANGNQQKGDSTRNALDFLLFSSMAKRILSFSLSLSFCRLSSQFQKNPGENQATYSHGRPKHDLTFERSMKALK